MKKLKMNPYLLSTMGMDTRHAMGMFLVRYDDSIRLWKNYELVMFQPEHLRPDLLEERIAGAMPCHNYKGKGETPQGCW